MVISGNHDSAARLGVGSRVLVRGGVHLCTDVAQVGKAVQIGQMSIYPIPYLEPDAVAAELEVEGRGHEAVLGAAELCLTLGRVAPQGHDVLDAGTGAIRALVSTPIFDPANPAYAFHRY